MVENVVRDSLPITHATFISLLELEQENETHWKKLSCSIKFAVNALERS